MDESHIHPCVIHLCDHTVGGELDIPEVGREELLGGVLTVDRPDDTASFVINPKIHIGEAGEVVASFGVKDS
jgi:hypothetical protein